jgi:hypothetical protein
MAQTAAQKKALAAAQALIKKQQASLKKLEAEQKTMTDAQAAVDKQLTDDAYYTKTLASGKTQAQIDALRNAYDTSNLINRVDPNNVSSVDRTTGQVTTKIDPNKGKGTGSAFSAGSPLTTYTAPDGRIFTDLAQYNAYIAQTKQEEKRRQGQSAYDLLFSEFDRYGMGALVEPLKRFIQDGISPAEFTIRLRETDAYKKRFAANAQRIGKGLRALSEAEYITMEDQYQNVMRQYGLPDTYYTRGEMGRQEGFEKFIAGDVSAVELEDRISTAQKRVLNANPEVTAALKQFYPDITNADILAYTLDPKNAIENIKRKVTAAEIGGAALQAGLQTGMSRAEELAAAGITKQQAQQGFQTVAEVAPRGGQLAEMYKQNPYTQTTAETEIFGLGGSAEAARQRKRLTSLETAQFGGSAGAGAIARDRAGVL